VSTEAGQAHLSDEGDPTGVGYRYASGNLVRQVDPVGRTSYLVYDNGVALSASGPWSEEWP